MEHSGIFYSEKGRFFRDGKRSGIKPGGVRTACTDYGNGAHARAHARTAWGVDEASPRGSLRLQNGSKTGMQGCLLRVFGYYGGKRTVME